MKDQPLSADASPTALSPGYISSNDDNDDDDDDVKKDEEDEEEEEHLASADPSAVPTDDLYSMDVLFTHTPRSPYIRQANIQPSLLLLLPSSSTTTREWLRKTMTTVNQGMSVEDIGAGCSPKTRLQEYKVAENANNKRKWEGNHNRQCTVKSGNCKKVGHMTQDCRNPTAARNQVFMTLVLLLWAIPLVVPLIPTFIANNLFIHTFLELHYWKRKFENTSQNSQNQQQQQIKRQNTGRAYTAGLGDKKPYGGSKPLCSKCNYHHDGPCAPKCYKCNKYGHIARDCRGTGNANAVNNQRVTVTSQKIICYECGNQGHYKRDCPERKNQSHKNQIEGTRAHGVVHTLRGGETDQGPNNIKDGIEA
ncbi:reverse transcriptase domain-containing protein [Tanacetum coccineum]